HDIRLGKPAANASDSLLAQAIHALEGGGGVKRQEQVYKIAAAGAAESQPLDTGQPLQAAQIGGDFAAQLGRRLIQQCTGRAAAQAQCQPEQCHSDRAGGNGIGVQKSGNSPMLAGGYQGQAQQNGQAGSHVAGEIEGIGGQRIALVGGCGTAQDTGAAPVHGNGGEHDGKSPGIHVDRRLDAGKPASRGDGRNRQGSNDQQAGLQEGGEVFKISVTERMVGVSGSGGHAKANEGKQGGEQVQSGMSGFGEDAQTAGVYTDKQLKNKDPNGRQQGNESHPLLNPIWMGGFHGCWPSEAYLKGGGDGLFFMAAEC